MENIKYIKGRLPGLGSYLFIFSWFLLVVFLASDGFFIKRNRMPISNLQITILAPMVLFWTFYFISVNFKNYILSLDLFFLNAVQCFRILGGAIFIIWGYGLLPGGFAIPMSILDMSVGFIALYVIVYMFHERSGWLRFSYGMNLWGFLDFFITIALVFLWKPLSIDPPKILDDYTTILELPLSLFPSFAIGFFSCVHFAALINTRHLIKLKKLGNKDI